MYEHIPILYPTSCSATHSSPILTFCICFHTICFLPLVCCEGQHHWPCSQLSQGSQSGGVPLIWIRFREGLITCLRVFSSNRTWQGLVDWSVLLRAGLGRGEMGISTEAAFTYLCAKSWYVITSLPTWWDQFACCSFSDHCHLMRLLPCRKGQGHWQQNPPAGTIYWCAHVYVPIAVIW